MSKKFTRLLLCLTAIASLVSFAECSSNKTPSSNPNGTLDTSHETKIKVSVSFDAMKEFVQAVGKDKVEISTIIPAGMEPHDFEPKAQDLVALSNAQIFVYNGLGMEAWAEEAISASSNSKLIVVEASKNASMIENTDPDEIKERGQYNPHLWLSLKGAVIEAKNIKDALVQADIVNKDYYEHNCSDFTNQLDNLFNDYSRKFQSVTQKSFVTGHAAFGYLCRDFELEQNSVEDTFADGEPTAHQLSELVEYCKENKVTTIFAEEMASPEVARTLAKEVGAKVETIYTIESAEDNMNYLQRMEDNLSKIYDSLK